MPKRRELTPEQIENFNRTVTIYASECETLLELSPAELGNVMHKILCERFSMECTIELSKIEKIVYLSVIGQINRSTVRKLNGAKGGGQSGNTNAKKEALPPTPTPPAPPKTDFDRIRQECKDKDRARGILYG